MIFFNKFYLGVTKERYEEPRDLGFIIPYDNPDLKATKKRKQTVDNWKDKEIPGMILENTPTKGFKLVSVVHRYNTSNKLFRVYDPRGFELELSSDNLLDTLMKVTVVNGEFVGAFVWATQTTPTLVPANDEMYLQWKKADSTKEKMKFEEGQYYLNQKSIGSIFRYEGLFYRAYVERNAYTTKIHQTESDNSMYFYPRVRYSIDEFDANYEIFLDKAKVHIFTEFTEKDDGSFRIKNVHVKRTPFNFMLPYENNTDGMDHVVDVNNCEKRIDIGTNSVQLNKYFKNKDDAILYDFHDSINEDEIPVYRIEKKIDHLYFSGSCDFDKDVKKNIHVVDKRGKNNG